jgi:hypothetical protein
MNHPAISPNSKSPVQQNLPSTTMEVTEQPISVRFTKVVAGWWHDMI